MAGVGSPASTRWIGAEAPLTAFRHLVEAIGIRAGQALFFDGSAENLQAAGQAGLQTVQVQRAADIAQALVESELR